MRRAPLARKRFGPPRVTPVTIHAHLQSVAGKGIVALKREFATVVPDDKLLRIMGFFKDDPGVAVTDLTEPGALSEQVFFESVLLLRRRCVAPPAATFER